MTNSSNPHRLSAAMQNAGYAVMHSVLEGGSERIVTVSIAQQRATMGFTQFRPQETVQTADDIRREGLVAMAGVVALRKLLGTTDSGCSAGLIRTQMAAERFVLLTEGPGPNRGPRITEVMEQWATECGTLVDANAEKIRKVSDALLERESLTATDVSALLA